MTSLDTASPVESTPTETRSIAFHRPTLTGFELPYVTQAVENGRLSGDGPFTMRCRAWLESTLGANRVLLTPSCTDAIEMAILLCGIGPGDEVILPSFTFPSCASAIALRSAVPVFVDIDRDSMNVDPKQVERAITVKTKAILITHYAGASCDMDRLSRIARSYDLFLIEDAAQAFFSRQNGRALGTIGHLGCISFHETKNIHCGEGGALLVNDPGLVERAEIIREKGTNRTSFLRGDVTKYEWVETGSSYLMSDLNAAFLLAQLERADRITTERQNKWSFYRQRLASLEENGWIDLPPEDAGQNGHVFFIKVKLGRDRAPLMDFLRGKGIATSFHFVPLHSTKPGERLGRFSGLDCWTTRESERLLRLPVHQQITSDDQEYVAAALASYFQR